MARVCVWFLAAVLSVLSVEKQDAHVLAPPKEVNVYAEGGLENHGVWKMNVEWEDGSTNSIHPDKVTYDVHIFYSETNKLVHNETLQLKANQAGRYKWSWISPLPLQCTAHSVRLRYRDGDVASSWTTPQILSVPDMTETELFPQNHVALVSEGIRFCCILKPDRKEAFQSSVFTIKISERTYATEPIRHPYPSPAHGFEILCENGGSVYYTGYAPDDHSLTCETRDLISVECHWKQSEHRNLSEIVKRKNYSINGRNCINPGFCVVDDTIDTGLVNWTLTATNQLGTKVIFDTADPNLRVRLTAPTLKPVTLLTARNAGFEWIWNGVKYASFPMICQVEVNGHIVNAQFEGTGLTSVTLDDLEPFTQYNGRVRCGSRQHFYKWGDWSNLISFFTKEDVPEAVDVWMQVFNEHTYVVWKNLSEAQSHGIITSYTLVMGRATNGTKEHVTKSPLERCHEVQAGGAKTPLVYSVSAINSAGVSRPSSITLPNLSPGAGIIPRKVSGNNGVFELIWEPIPKSTCGYVLDWYPTYNAQQCSVQWIKIPSSVYSAKISSDFKEGVKYTLSVYGCTSEAPYLLQRSEGYMVELPPSGKVQNLTATQEGLNVYLSWGNVHEHEQRGFIKGYNVSYSHAGGDSVNIVISDPNIQKHKFSLPVETYIFTVKAFTSAGDGPSSETTISMDPYVDLVIIKVTFILAVMLVVLCVISLLFYRNRKCVKSALWPEVPKPSVSDDFLKKNIYQGQVMDHLLGEESEVLKVKIPEICPAFLVLDQEKEHQDSQNLYSSPSKVSPASDTYQTPSGNPQTLPLVIDLSYQEVPCPGIPNPTYNLPVMPEADKVLALGYRPQTQRDSNS